jgi:hypothetical protein
MNANIQLSATHLLDCIEEILDIFLEEAETADIAAAARRRKVRNGALAAAGALGIALTIIKIARNRVKGREPA